MGTVTIKRKGSLHWTLRSIKPGEAFKYGNCLGIVREQLPGCTSVFLFDDPECSTLPNTTIVDSVNITVTEEHRPPVESVDEEALKQARYYVSCVPILIEGLKEIEDKMGVDVMWFKTKAFEILREWDKARKEK